MPRSGLLIEWKAPLNPATQGNASYWGTIARKGHGMEEGSQPGKRRYPNFDVLRLCAASGVIFSHSFVIADGGHANEPLVRLLGPENPIGIYGVFVFFIMSGFLVSRSVSQTGSLARLLMRRILRIYPALTICALICGFIIAAMFAREGATSYWSTDLGFRYVAKILLLLDPLYIDGVIFYPDTKSFGGIINGSLWTLLQEAQFYIAVLIIAALGFFNAAVAVTGAVAGTLLFYLMTRGIIAPPEGAAMNVIYSLSAICAGMTMHFVHQRIGRIRWLSLACLIALAAAIPLGLLATLFPVLAAYPLIHLGMSDTVRLGNVTRWGDVTYGTYLYGWPTQQIMRAAWGDGISGWSLFFLSWPTALICGWLSWHLIERHFVLGKLIGPWNRMVQLCRAKGAKVWPTREAG
jgi:peptidoglycan/LPS O-acetylase OafA/YrhL